MADFRNATGACLGRLTELYERTQFSLSKAINQTDSERCGGIIEFMCVAHSGSETYNKLLWLATTENDENLSKYVL